MKTYTITVTRVEHWLVDAESEEEAEALTAQHEPGFETVSQEIKEVAND